MPTENDFEYGVPAHIIPKNKKDQVRISINEFHGKEYLDIRQFYKADGGVWKPTPKGVTIPQELYSELLRGILLLGEMIGADIKATLDSEDRES